MAAKGKQFPWRWNGGTIFPEFGSHLGNTELPEQTDRGSIAMHFNIGSFLLLTAALLFAGCSTPTYEEMLAHGQEKVSDPSESIWIYVNSVPTGASIYTLHGGQPGSLLGKTPAVLRYAWAGPYTTYGDNPDETLSFEIRTRLLFFKTVRLVFTALVVKEGYKPYVLRHVFKDKDLDTSISVALAVSLNEGAQKVFTAVLTPSLPTTQQPVAAQPPTDQVVPPAFSNTSFADCSGFRQRSEQALANYDSALKELNSARDLAGLNRTTSQGLLARPSTSGWAQALALINPLLSDSQVRNKERNVEIAWQNLQQARDLEMACLRR